MSSNTHGTVEMIFEIIFNTICLIDSQSFKQYSYPYLPRYDYYNYEGNQYYYPYTSIYNNNNNFQTDYINLEHKTYSRVYIDQLNEIQRKCDEELNKMHRSICDLRKLKRNWKLYEPKTTYSSSIYYQTEKFPESDPYHRKESSTTTLSSSYEESTPDTYYN